MERYLKLAQGQLGLAVPTPMYTCPIGYSAVVRHIRLSNTSEFAAGVSLRQGGVADLNVILPEVAVVAGGWGEFDGTIMMGEGEVMYGHADAEGAVAYAVFGVEVET